MKTPKQQSGAAMVASSSRSPDTAVRAKRGPIAARLVPLIALAILLVLGSCTGKGTEHSGSAAGPSDAEMIAAAPEPRATPLRCTVVYLEGDVQVNGVPVEIGDILSDVFTVRTGPASSCDLVFQDKNAVRIGQNAVATLDLSKTVLELDLQKGGATSVLRKLEKLAGGDSFRVRTPGASAGVRGTSFCVWVDDESTYICACNGEVRTIDASGGNEYDLLAAHHKAKLYVKEGAEYRTQDAGLLHHDDESVESLAARIGETIDWTVPD